MTFSDAEETINDSELPDFKEDGIDVEMHLADRYICNILFNKSYFNVKDKFLEFNTNK